MPSHHWPCNTSWEHFMSHDIYYMSHTIDKWNVYCSYTIKCIFLSIRISRFDLEKIKNSRPQRHFFSAMLTRTKNVNLFGLNISWHQLCISTICRPRVIEDYVFSTNLVTLTSYLFLWYFLTMSILYQNISIDPYLTKLWLSLSPCLPNKHTQPVPR